MSETERYYRRVIVLEVLSNEPVETDNLGDVWWEITDGEASGWILSDTTTAVSAEAMRGLLLAQNGDADFLLGEWSGEEEN